MSTSMCGPSNALASLNKHTSVDRSHQRDVQRPRFGQPAQDLRSSHNGASSAQVENDFASFSGQAGGMAHNRFHPTAHPTAHPAAHPAAMEMRFQEPANDNWAADFQRLEIQSMNPGMASANVNASWAQSFGQTQATATQQRNLMQPQFGMSGTPMMDYTSSQNYAPALLQAQHGSAQELEWDESAFENAFEQAARDLEAVAPTEQDVAQATPSQSQVEETAQVVVEEVVEEEAEKKQEAHDSDALAHTAGQLLNSVGQNSSEKFQQSNFLALMRKLRDREVIVEGDTMVEKQR